MATIDPMNPPPELWTSAEIEEMSARRPTYSPRYWTSTGRKSHLTRLDDMTYEVTNGITGETYRGPDLDEALRVFRGGFDYSLHIERVDFRVGDKQE
jgi:hypothetical protein